MRAKPTIMPAPRNPPINQAVDSASNEVGVLDGSAQPQRQTDRNGGGNDAVGNRNPGREVAASEANRGEGFHRGITKSREQHKTLDADDERCGRLLSVREVARRLAPGEQ